MRIAAMPIAGIAGMKNVTVTCAPEIGESIRIRELYAKHVCALMRRIRVGGQIGACLRSRSSLPQRLHLGEAEQTTQVRLGVGFPNR